MKSATTLILGLAAGLAASGACADLLDFDGVCASPPCLIGNRYSNFAFTPSTLQIVQAGSDGLTGPVGGKYLSVPANVGMSVTAIRDLKSISLRVARANTSAGPITFTFHPRKGTQMLGVPPMSFQLNGVNEWITIAFSFQAAGPFDGFIIYAGETIGVDALQMEMPCYGFADVQPTDAFCNAVEWMANRSVTLGCGGGLYCPSSPVTRSQIALFMQRLGEAIGPVVLLAECLRTGDFATLQRSCLVSVDSKPYPRVAAATSSCGVTSDSQTTKTLASDIVWSDDNSATWTALGPTLFAVLPNAHRAAVSQTSAIDLRPGVGYVFAHELSNVAGDAVQAVSADCTVVVTVGSRTGTASPY